MFLPLACRGQVSGLNSDLVKPVYNSAPPSTETEHPEHGVQRRTTRLLYPVLSIQHATQLPDATTEVLRYTHTHTHPWFLLFKKIPRGLLCLFRTCFSTTGSDAGSSSSINIGDPAGGALEQWSGFGLQPRVHKSVSDLGSDSAPGGNGASLTSDSENVVHIFMSVTEKTSLNRHLCFGSTVLI